MGSRSNCSWHPGRRPERSLAGCSPNQNRAIYNLTDADPTLAALSTSRKPSTAVRNSTALKFAPRESSPTPGCYATSIILALAPLLQRRSRRPRPRHHRRRKIRRQRSRQSRHRQDPLHVRRRQSLRLLCRSATATPVNSSNSFTSLRKTSSSPRIFSSIPRGILSTIYLRLANQLTAARHRIHLQSTSTGPAPSSVSVEAGISPRSSTS